MAAAFALASCVKGPELPMQTLKLDLEAVVAPHMGATYEVPVNSNTAWKVKNSAEDWITTSVVDFTGSTALKITIQPNGETERTAVVTLMSADETASAEINIVQSGSKAEGFISISALRALAAEGDRTITGNDAKVKGFVITDAEQGNWTSESFAMEDSFTEKYSGIAVKASGAAFKRGEEVAVVLEGAKLAKDENGRLVLEALSAPVKTESTPIAIEPLEITVDDLIAGYYESMYVTVKEFQVVEEAIGGVLSSSPLFENAKGKRLQLNVSGESVFAQDEYKEGAGNLAGIAGAAAAVPTITPVISDDVNLGQMRFGVLPGIRKLPYVFSFYCYEQTNGKFKYINYEKVPYNTATQLVKGVAARDADEKVGAYLEFTTFGKASDNIYGMNAWAEGGAHDNINVSGFLTYPDQWGDNAAPEECGIYLTVPLQMNMPTDFNVSFGMGGNDYSKAKWMVSYSADKKTWYKSESVVIDHKVDGGSYYLYFTVPVHLEIPILAESNLYIKFTPVEGYCVKYGLQEGRNKYDGHGNSCWIRLHSAIVISEEVKGNTSAPSGAVYFEAFDNLTAGMDYFIGDRLAAFANYCADGISTWTEEQTNGMTGTHVYERPGYAQIGFVDAERSGSRSSYTNSLGALTTPALGQAGDMKLTFKAAAYKSPAIREKAATSTPDVGSPDITEAVVEVIGGGTINGATTVAVTGLPTDSFGTFTYEIKGATAATQLRFTSAPAEGQFSRWFIDEICVTR